MSRLNNSETARRKIHALLFAALGDETRLGLVARLSIHSPQSISELAEDSELTRQAITKHLQVLQNAGVVKNVREGRESLYEFNPQSLDKVRSYLDNVAARWEEALIRFKSFVER